MNNSTITRTMTDELKTNNLEIEKEENLANFSRYFTGSGGGKFFTVVEVIATFEKHPQVFFDMLVENRLDDTPREIERNYLVTALRFIDELKADLWKISTCTYNTKHLRPSEQAKVQEFISYKNGKFFFYPHMRDYVESHQCFEDPDLARDLVRY